MQILLPVSLKLDRRHAERVWANCLRKLFPVGFVGVGILCGGFLPSTFDFSWHLAANHLGVPGPEAAGSLLGLGGPKGLGTATGGVVGYSSR